MEMKKFAETMKILGEINRLRIFKLLQSRPAYVCEIAEVLGVSMATVSSHLSVLKRFGIVEDNREGVKIRYSLKEPQEPEVRRLLQLLKELGEDWQIVQKDREKLKLVSMNLQEVCQRQRSSSS